MGRRWIRKLASRLVSGQEGVVLQSTWGADGFANWQAGWSVAKKEWCCRVHGKGCPNQGGGRVTSSKPYDCNAGFANWMAGWSVAKKAWCCSNEGKGCPPAAGGCA